jgi:hypothetical protein
VGNYDEMSTARLTWLVLDRLVPSDEEAAARAALIARDPELHSLVTQGTLSEDDALEALRARQRTRYGDHEGALGELCVRWAARLATFLGGCFFAWLLLHVGR